jgi:ATP-binding cassette, subfamily B, bacterial
VRELALDERLRDDADHLTARRERPVRDRAHQADLAAAVDEPEPARGRRRAECPRGGGICRSPSARSTAEDADPAHRTSVPAFSTVPGMHRGFRGVREKPERPADPAVRRANLRRIAGLFRDYRGRLSAVLVLILIGGVQSVVTSTATSIVSNVTTVIASMVGMIALSWELSLFAFALVPLFVLLTRRVGDERRKIASSTQETLADISSLVQESLSVSGVLLGKTMGRTDELADRFEGESRLLADLEVRQRMAGRWMMASIQTTFAVMPAAVYWFGGLALAHGSNAVSVPTLVAFTTLQTRLFFPVGSLLGVGLDVQTSLALFDRIFDYLDQPVDIEERPDARTLDAAGDVAFRDVWFRYGADAWTLRDVSFSVPAGSKTALVGETGSGKTTVGYLAARLYDVDQGAISIGGVDLRDLTFASLASLVGVVSQETYLFHASVRDNLRFAKPDATDEELVAAADAAQIHELIASLPEGYDTVVGERGYRFSGGEKQRIAIARTVLRNPPILVLDEATSSLDNETERQVQEALDRLAEGRTTIAIAHRISTIADADQILVLDHGQIVERGRHDDLLTLGGRYAELVGRAGESDREPALGL